MYNWECKNCPLYGVARCPLFRGCLNLKGMEGQSGILELSIIIVGVHSRGVFDKWGSSLVFRFDPPQHNV